MISTIKKILFLVLFLQLGVFAQKREIGGGLGVFHYKGDISPRFQPFSGRGGANLFFRYNASRAFSYKLGVVTGSVAAKDSKSTDQFQTSRNYEFKSNISEINTQVEYNFLNFRQGFSNFRKQYTPYVFGGISYFSFSPTPYTGDYKTKAIAIPYGVGFKSVWRGPWNWGIEFGTRKLFTDDLDDLGVVNNTAKMQQGNPETYDKYYYTNISLSYTFYKIACPK